MDRHISADFAKRMRGIFGADGEAWLAGLPALIAATEARWGITVGPPFPLTYSYVAPATRADGSEAVLKMAVPHPDATRAIAALELYDGRGSVRLLAADAPQGIALLERLRPGTTLFELGDDTRATQIAAEVMQQLWRPAPAEGPFSPVREWAMEMQQLRIRYDGGTGPLPARLVDIAEQLFTELYASEGAPVVLHGDLHHWNIVAAERQPWLALDPNGMTGEPAYEVGAWLRNPMDPAHPHLMDQPDVTRIQARRLAQFAEILGFDRRRLAAWGAAQAVLSAWWTLDGENEVDHATLACAEVLAGLL